jgi:hypothetical protein
VFVFAQRVGWLLVEIYLLTKQILANRISLIYKFLNRTPLGNTSGFHATETRCFAQDIEASKEHQYLLGPGPSTEAYKRIRASGEGR